MTVSSTQNKISYIGNGIVKEFTIPFKFFEPQEIEVYMTSEDMPETKLMYGDDYHVEIEGEDKSGTLNMNIAPEGDQKITLIRVIPMTQEIDYRENEIFPAKTHEMALDKLTMIVQQNAEKLTRTLSLGITSETNPDEVITHIFNAEINAANSALSASKKAEEAIGAMDQVVLSAQAAEAHANEAKAIADEFKSVGDVVVSTSIRYLIRITESEYAALSEEEKNDPYKLYAIAG